MLAASPLPTSSARSAPSSPAAPTQLGIFFLAYLVYSAARYVTVGDLASAQDHANWIMNLEQDLGVEVESWVETAWTGTWILWLLNHAYLAAQLVVLPGSLIFLYRRLHGRSTSGCATRSSRPGCSRSRSTASSRSRRRAWPTAAWSTRSARRRGSRWNRA